MFEGWRVAPGVDEAEDGGTLILLTPRGRYAGVEGVARDLWEALKRGELARAVGEIADRCAVDSETVRRDAERFLSDLAREGLAVRVGA